MPARTAKDSRWSKLTAISSVVAGLAAWLLLSACHSANDGDDSSQGCSPTCGSTQVCCYTFLYLTPSLDGGTPSLTFDAASQEGISAPKCGTLIDYDAGPYGEINAELDGSLGKCGLYPPG